MTSKKKSAKRPSSRPRRTAIVPRVVFQTLVAVAVVPAASVLAGCGQSTTANHDAGVFSVVAPLTDAGRDMGVFAVALPIDSGTDTGAFSVAVPNDAGNDVGVFAVAVPLDGAFSVIIAPFDAASS
jgi:hypothetical protein